MTRMRDFMTKHITHVHEMDRGHFDPLRIGTNGHRNYYQEHRWSAQFRHRQDRDVLLFYTSGTRPGSSHNSDPLDALAYMRRRMAYTRSAINAADTLDEQIAVWRLTGIATRLGRVIDDEDLKYHFHAHRAVYIDLIEFMGPDVFAEFMAATPEGDDNE